MARKERYSQEEEAGRTGIGRKERYRHLDRKERYRQEGEV